MAELEILNAEKQEAESVIASVSAEIADAREEVEESKKHLDEINEQIADRKKRYAVYEKKIDKVLAVGKPVEKEIAGMYMHRIDARLMHYFLQRL